MTGYRQVKKRFLRVIQFLATGVSDVFARMRVGCSMRWLQANGTLRNCRSWRFEPCVVIYRTQLEVALEGQFTEPHATLIGGALQWVDVLSRQIARIDQELDELLTPMAPQREQLESIAGISEMTARDLIAEIGLDMTRFGSAPRPASWAGLSPGNDESADKRRKGRTRKGNRYLRRVLGQGAWATCKTPTFLGRTSCC
jgi:transposase